MRRGDLVYITVEGFTPTWRQAVVVSVNKEENKIVFAVRVAGAELADRWQDLSFFELSGEKFILVEGKAAQARQSCDQRHRALEVEAEVIIKRARELVHSSSDELQYATASEDARERSRKVRTTLQPDIDLTDSSSGDGDSGDSQDEDGLLKLLSRAKSNLRGGGFGSDVLGKGSSSSKPSKSRYPMLDSSKEKSVNKKESVVETLLQQSLLASASSGGKSLGGDQLNTLLQMEMLKLLQDKSKKSVKTEEKDTSDSAGSEEDSSADNRERLRGAGKALKAYRKEKREMQKNPKRHIRRYIKEVEAVLGVSRDTPYLLTDFTKRISWGKHRTLQRLHYAISDTLQLQLAGHTDRAGLQMTQILRAIHQCSLDQGDWRVAWHLLHLQDPVEKPRFGGEPQQLEVVAGYIRAMNDLEKKSRMSPNLNQNGDDPPENQKGGKGKGKKKKAEAENLEG